MKHLLNLLGALLLFAGLAGFGVYLWEYFGESRMKVVAHAEQVQPGMAGADVVALLGQPEESLTQTWEDDEGRTWSRKFYVENQAGWFVVRSRTTTVDFQGDKVAK